MKHLFLLSLFAISFLASNSQEFKPHINDPKVEGKSFYAYLSNKVNDTTDKWVLVIVNKTYSSLDVEMWYPEDKNPTPVDNIWSRSSSTEKLRKGCYNLKIRRKNSGGWMELPVVNVK